MARSRVRRGETEMGGCLGEKAFSMVGSLHGVKYDCWNGGLALGLSLESTRAGKGELLYIRSIGGSVRVAGAVASARMRRRERPRRTAR
eukprot:scaffold16329_cov121-Isochrysis_galbana.AAC.8